MFYTYVLRSLSHSTLYVGSSDNPERRLLEQHNKGRVRYTKGRKPWIIVWNGEFATRSDAMKRERFLKSGKGREYLKKVLGSTPGSSNGRTADSESANLGSNPSPGVLPRS